MPSLETINPKIKILLLILSAVFLVGFTFFVYKSSQKDTVEKNSTATVANEEPEDEKTLAEKQLQDLDAQRQAAEVVNQNSETFQNQIKDLDNQKQKLDPKPLTEEEIQAQMNELDALRKNSR